MAETLTVDELAVLRCLAEGMTTRECADKLDVSPAEVLRHRRSAIEKLGATNETNAVALAIRRRLLP